MKRFDDDFLELYNRYEAAADGGESEGGEGNMEQCYQNVLRKAGLARRGRRRARILLIAAVMAALTLTAAAVYRASDAFRGILSVHESAQNASSGESGPSAPAVLDRAGKVLGDKRRSGNVDVVLRAAVGDDQGLKLLVDVADIGGAPLALAQPDGSLSRQPVRFGDIVLENSGGSQPESIHYNNDVFDSNPLDDKMTLLYHFTLSGAPVRGETYRISFEDLMQTAVQRGTPLKMEPDALYDIVRSFAPPPDAAFQRSGYHQQVKDGPVVYDYMLRQQTDRRLPLSDDAPGVAVTNAAVRDGFLYLTGTSPSGEDVLRLIENAALVGPDATFNWDGSSTRGGEWSLRFAGVESVEALRGCVWTLGEGEGLYTLAEGKWDFTFTLDYDDTTLQYAADADVRVGQSAVRVVEARLSPFTAALDFTADSAAWAAMYPPRDGQSYHPPSAWEKSPKPITLTMKDGSTLKSEYPGDGHADGGGRGTLLYALDEVIDPAQVVSIRLGDTDIPLKR